MSSFWVEVQAALGRKKPLPDATNNKKSKKKIIIIKQTIKNKTYYF
jgi:hypothetical protein